MIPPWSGPFTHGSTSELTGLPLAGSLKNRLIEKRWCYAGVVCPELFFGAAVVHLGYVTSAFCFVFDRVTREMTEQTHTWPPLGHARYDRHPESGTCSFKGLGKDIRIKSSPEGFTKKIYVRLSSIQADLELKALEKGFFPMHFPMDMGEGKKAFTTKAAGLKARGEIRVNTKVFTLSRDTAWGLFAWTHGAYPRQTFWNWTCGAGRAETEKGDTVSLGFNFSRGVYENGRLENTVWINGRPEPVSEMTYEYDPDHPLSPWQIISKDKKVTLTFYPEGMRSANENFGLLASRFIQPCGRFEGEIITHKGSILTLKSLSGVVEEHYAKW